MRRRTNDKFAVESTAARWEYCFDGGRGTFKAANLHYYHSFAVHLSFLIVRQILAILPITTHDVHAWDPPRRQVSILLSFCGDCQLPLVLVVMEIISFERLAIKFFLECSRPPVHLWSR